jgi:hypothetical protein
MIKVVLALVGLALIASGGECAPRSKAKQKRKAPLTAPMLIITPVASTDTVRVADWIASSGDNHSLPYAIIDKMTASLFLFDGQGKSLGSVPVLIGIAAGDDATPGVGSKKLGEIGPAEKTTPAGRFLAKFGLAAGKQKVLWVDYANSVAIHPIPADAGRSEQRQKRMLSPETDDNRITFGCINVPLAFYGKSIRPLYQKKGGYVYVMPDTKPLEMIFPRLRVHALTSTSASS